MPRIGTFVKRKSKVDHVYDSIKSFLITSKVKDLRHELNGGTDPMLYVLKDFSKFLNLPEKKYLKRNRESKAIHMVEAIKKKTTPPREGKKIIISQMAGSQREPL